MTSEKLGVAAFFVYGTLKPQGLYWPRIADLVLYWEPAQVRGRLYDTGLGYPAALFEGDELMDGVLLFVAKPNEPRTIEVMDYIEQEGREYRRVQIITPEGVQAWAYEWTLGTEALRPIDGF